MKWTPEDVARERPDLQALATYKYDGYQQYSPGGRFIESLARWLEQFETDEERRTAYGFVRTRLIFVSEAEMAHLVVMSYPHIIRPFLAEQVASVKRIHKWKVTRITESEEFRILLRQSVFLGLSDGSHIDVFRRSASPDVCHEQILRTHEISPKRQEGMLEKLEEDLAKLLGRKPSNNAACFHTVFLLDDFSGSGISYLRKGEGVSPFEGKIAAFYYDHCMKKDGNSSLIDPSDAQVCLILYIATSQAKEYLEKNGRELFGPIPFHVKVVNLLPNAARLNDDKDQKFLELLPKYYDSSIESKSYMKGRHQKPYLGFDECALPLVLSHNTPNNSVPLLWFEENRKFRGLFPRISRF
jgi:hypothetical protein